MVSIPKHQRQFQCHVMREEGIENLIFTRKIERYRSREREIFMQAAETWMNVSEQEELVYSFFCFPSS